MSGELTVHMLHVLTWHSALFEPCTVTTVLPFTLSVSFSYWDSEIPYEETRKYVSADVVTVASASAVWIASAVPPQILSSANATLIQP